MPGTALYMMALMPPPELTKTIENIRIEFSKKYNCVKALKPPVHITLIPPYKTSADTEKLLIDSFTEWGRSRLPFDVVLEDYAAFLRNGVVYIDVRPNEQLQSFRADLRDRFLSLLPLPEVKKDRSFHPHITIGYRDIPPEVLPAAVEEYASRQFSAAFHAGTFYLWKHNRSRWEVLSSFAIGNSNR